MKQNSTSFRISSVKRKVRAAFLRPKEMKGNLKNVKRCGNSSRRDGQEFDNMPPLDQF